MCSVSPLMSTHAMLSAGCIKLLNSSTHPPTHHLQRSGVGGSTSPSAAGAAQRGVGAGQQGLPLHHLPRLHTPGGLVTGWLAGSLFTL